MKKYFILLVLGTLFLMNASVVDAQVSVSININAQPQWGPDQYDHVEYYYLPEIGMYYYVPKAQFIYQKGNRWVYARELPYQYRNLDLYGTYKVVINEPRPYLRNGYYVSHYKKYGSYHSKQGNIGPQNHSRIKEVRSHQTYGKNKMGNRPQNKNQKSEPNVKNKKSGHEDFHKNKR